MNKFFNTAGLCSTDKHYMVEPLKRLATIENLISKELYFVIHAPVNLEKPLRSRYETTGSFSMWFGRISHEAVV